MKIALVGNPNCGKTTMFNDMTGAYQYVGNWPGVTVEKKTGKLLKDKKVQVVDLPGIYSLSPYTLEEVITRDYIKDESPDVIINIVDATNLERNLYLTGQVLEMGVPTVIALNMMDMAKKSGLTVDIKKLEKKLGVPVIPTSAVKGDGLNELISKAIEIGQKHTTPNFQKFGNEVECPGTNRRRRTWQAAKSCGELQANIDPQMSEWSNPHRVTPMYHTVNP